MNLFVQMCGGKCGPPFCSLYFHLRDWVFPFSVDGDKLGSAKNGEGPSKRLVDPRWGPKIQRNLEDGSTLSHVDCVERKK